MATLLQQLSNVTTVVADTGDLAAIQAFQPIDATTNPSLVLKAMGQPLAESLISTAVAWAKQQGGDQATQLDNTADKLVVSLGMEILKHIPGRVSTEVDARLSFDTEKTLAKARKLIKLYEDAGIGRERVLIKIASTWEGIKAAEILEKEGINCNLTLLFSFAQARACAESGVFLISPFVGRILDWFKKQNPGTDYAPEEEPGVVSVSDIFNYYKRHGYNTIVMGASFRNIGEIIALAGCDRLTISPNLLEELSASEGNLQVRLHAQAASADKPQALSEAEFRWLHNEDAMATEKLAEGIRLFAVDQNKLEKMLSERLVG
ncbi:transaldolase [Pokkaliibacter plantistimulans]|uniref:Transaldolase n=1 Tax=Proteobacteria bacterium 228 TaxID=2083153 RepID=A0A2S5KNQ5_9PROT|nr:transaldolase [Pokkaliibacter plantistimulans]PPC76477.1 transaldolase [Pokkaliibacter plantistimulans]